MLLLGSKTEYISLANIDIVEFPEILDILRNYKGFESLSLRSVGNITGHLESLNLQNLVELMLMKLI